MTKQELPAGWVWTTLGELCKPQYGKSLPQDQRSETAPVPVVGSSGVISRTTTPLTSEPCIVIGRKGNIGKSRIFDLPCWPIDTTFFVQPSDAVDRRYLNYVLSEVDFSKLNRSTTTPSLRREDLEAVSVALPPLAEQWRIVSALENHISRLDAIQLIMTQGMAKLENLSDMAIDFSRRDAEQARGAPPPPTSSDVIDGDLPQIPASWSWRRLGEIAEVVGGITKNAKTQADEGNPLHPYLRVANVQAGHLNLDHITEIRATPKQIAKLTLRGGDVLLNEGGDRDKLGRGWIWEDQIPNCLHQNHVFRARVDPEEIDPRLIAWHANSFGRAWFMQNGKQSVNLASVSLKTTRAFPVPVPPVEEQPAIVERITTALEEYSRLQSAIEIALARTAALRKALLRMAFSGELVDQNPDDEPASIALTKIRDQQSVTAPRRRRKTASAK